MKPPSQEIFLFAAKAGSLEGYLYSRRKVEPLDNWVNNLSRMYAALSPRYVTRLPLCWPLSSSGFGAGQKAAHAGTAGKAYENAQ